MSSLILVPYLSQEGSDVLSATDDLVSIANNIESEDTNIGSKQNICQPSKLVD